MIESKMETKRSNPSTLSGSTVGAYSNNNFTGVLIPLVSNGSRPAVRDTDNQNG